MDKNNVPMWPDIEQQNCWTFWTTISPQETHLTTSTPMWQFVACRCEETNGTRSILCLLVSPTTTIWFPFLICAVCSDHCVAVTAEQRLNVHLIYDVTMNLFCASLTKRWSCFSFARNQLRDCVAARHSNMCQFNYFSRTVLCAFRSAKQCEVAHNSSRRRCVSLAESSSANDVIIIRPIKWSAALCYQEHHQQPGLITAGAADKFYFVS